jgi:2'-5' RNA ligase
MLDPLILTLSLDPLLYAHLNALRKTHFPPARNFLNAHVTLFHHLPGEAKNRIADHLQDLCLKTQAFPLQLPTLRFLGKGVAVDLLAPPLLQLHQDLATPWSPWLTPQDRQRYHPHVTLQNKVDPIAARTLFTQLSTTWQPLHGHATGLQLWWYRGGPWQSCQDFNFQPQSA